MKKETLWLIVAVLVLAGLSALANANRPQWGTSDTMPD